MPLVDEAFSALTDLKASMGDMAAVGCHLFIFAPRTRVRRDEWLKVNINHDVAEKIADAARQAALRVETRAADDQALHEFDFDAMADESIGVLKSDEFEPIQHWLSQVPDNDWDRRFDGSDDVLEKARFYVVRLSFSDGRTATFFRGSRGIKISLETKGIISAAFSRHSNEMVSIDGPVITLDDKFDFISWDGHVFINNLLTFESITNIKDLTIEKANSVIDQISTIINITSGINSLKSELSKRIRLAKRLAAAHRHGIIADIDIEKLAERCRQKGLGLNCTVSSGVASFDFDLTDKQLVSDFVNLITDFYYKSTVTGREWEAVVKRPARAP